MSSERVLLVDAESPFSRAVAYCLAKAGREVFGISPRGWPAFRFSRYCAGFGRVREGVRYADAVTSFARECGAEILMATGLDGLQFLALHRVAFEAVARVAAGPAVDALSMAMDKGRFAEFARARGLPHPRTSRIDEAFAVPALLKPVHGEMGGGIRMVETRAQLAALRREQWIVQEYVPGTDMGCSVLCRGGRILAYTIQRGLLWRRKKTFAPPVAVEFVRDDRVLAAVSDCMEQLEWSGVANIDLRIDSRDGAVTILEVNGRYWASMLASERAGVNFPELACREAIGDELKFTGYRSIRSGGAAAYGRGKGLRMRNATFVVALLDPLPIVATRLIRSWSSPSTGIPKMEDIREEMG